MQLFKLPHLLQICPFLYVIRLVGWLKHRNRSRSGRNAARTTITSGNLVPSDCLASLALQVLMVTLEDQHTGHIDCVVLCMTA